MADGTSKPITEVREGDAVLAWDEASGTTGSYRVVATWVNADPATTYLTIDGDRLLATPAHPFATQERGWVPAGLLKIGEHIRKAGGGWGVVRAARNAWDAGVRYNLTVETAHTYAVGDGRWVAHNMCALSPNQMNRAIQTGRAPRGIKAVNTPKLPGEQLHVHFDNGAALNVDGTWKHGSTTLTAAQKKWLKENGWTLPSE